MRKIAFGVLIGCGLLAATAVPSLACSYNTQASDDSQTQQRTAQAETTSTTTAQ